MTPQQWEIPDEILDRLARGLVHIADKITEFYSDPKNEEAFQKWLAEKKASENK